MITFPNAKINIGLNIVSRRTDGYHNIETMFYPIALSDALEVIVSKDKSDYSFYQSGIVIDGNIENNLIIKAFKLLQKDFYLPAVDIFFHKSIPFGAGLGGGSADAAFMLKMLNEIFTLKLSDLELERHASKLGADCPFFIKNKPVFASGIGDSFQDINISLKGKYITLVKPDIHVSTADAYAGVQPEKPQHSLFDILQKEPIDNWKKMVKNDFEKTVFIKYPQIEKIKMDLYSLGATYVSMSGSGSTVFCFSDKKINCKSMFQDCFIWDGVLD